jgi:hypothetical protein
MMVNSPRHHLLRLPDRLHRDPDGHRVRDHDAVPAVPYGMGHVFVHRAVCECDGDESVSTMGSG